MNIGSATSIPDASLYEVKLAKGQEQQQEKVVSTIIESATSTAPASVTGVGGELNVKA